MTISQFGWNFDLRSYNLVPRNSPIFYFCEVGDLATVQQLLQDGKAGLLDVRFGPYYTPGVKGYETLIEVITFYHCFQGSD